MFNIKNVRFYCPFVDIWSPQCSINNTHTHTHSLSHAYVIAIALAYSTCCALHEQKLHKNTKSHCFRKLQLWMSGEASRNVRFLLEILMQLCGIGRKQQGCITCVQTTAGVLLHTVHKVFGTWINHCSVVQ